MDRKKREFMEKLDSIYKVVLQSSSKGISAVEIAKKLGKPESYRTTVHRYLNTLELMGKVRSEKGKWYPTDVKQKTVRNLPSEIKSEIEKVKADFIEGKLDSALRRLHILIYEIENLELPEGLRGELNKVMSEYLNELKKADVWRAETCYPYEKLLVERRIREHYKKTNLIMIPKILNAVSKIWKFLEEGVSHE